MRTRTTDESSRWTRRLWMQGLAGLGAGAILTTGRSHAAAMQSTKACPFGLNGQGSGLYFYYCVICTNGYPSSPCGGLASPTPLQVGCGSPACFNFSPGGPGGPPKMMPAPGGAPAVAVPKLMKTFFGNSKDPAGASFGLDGAKLMGKPEDFEVPWPFKLNASHKVYVKYKDEDMKEHQVNIGLVEIGFMQEFVWHLGFEIVAPGSEAATFLKKSPEYPDKSHRVLLVEHGVSTYPVVLRK